MSVPLRFASLSYRIGNGVQVHPLTSVGASNPNGTHNKMLVRGTNEKIVRATHSHPFLYVLNPWYSFDPRKS